VTRALGLAIVLPLVLGPRRAEAAELGVRILSSVGGAEPDTSEKRVRLGTPVTLELEVKDPKLGPIGEHHAPPPPWQVRWFKIEVADRSLSNTEPTFHFEPIHYRYVPIPACDDRFRCPADVRATLLGDRGGLGTMAFRAEVVHGGDQGASPGFEKLFRGGLPPDIARVTVRRDDSYLGYLTELFNTPYIWGSAGEPDAIHQTERRIGSDCADFVTYGVRRLGHPIPYSSTFGLRKYAQELFRSPGPGPDGVYPDQQGRPIPIAQPGDTSKDALRPGDLLLFPRHVGALVEDRPPLGVLSSGDVMIHTSWAEPAEQPIAETDYRAQPLSVLRWTALLAGTQCGAAELALAERADRHLRADGRCAEADLAAYRHGIEALLRCGAATATQAAAPFVFPVAGADLRAIGGKRDEGYLVNHPHRCFAIDGPGHPALDIFVPDPDQDALDADGRPFDAVAVADGAVLVTRTDWTPGDPGKGGNYVVLYLPAKKALAYYAHLSTVAVVPGERVHRGQRVGAIGRTGTNAAAARSPTHLHFALWDRETLAPINPYPALAAASR
jgi:hypothetical protein